MNKVERKEEDPFYSYINMERLRKAIKDIDNGKVKIHNINEKKDRL